MIKKDAPKVVYWLGAGASYNALPIVGEMPAAFLAQQYLLRAAISHELSGYITARDSKLYAEYLRKMAEWSSQYGTIDTYARSLFLLGKRKELAELKLHLSMYFMLAQVLPLKYPEVTPLAPPSYQKRDRLDTRYMGWLALMMDKERILPENVSVVSWNYDLQLDHAIAKYRGYHTLDGLLDKESRSISPRADGRLWAEEERPSIVRLNGVAGLAKRGEHYHYVCSRMRCDEGFNDNFIKYLFELYKDYDARDDKVLYGGVDTLTFAWEGNAMAEENITFAEDALRSAAVLVVIGYSFPSFNRQVDKRLFRAFLEQRGPYVLKRTVLQNRSLTPETFLKIMGTHPDEPPEVVQEQNLDQFYVPPELF